MDFQTLQTELVAMGMADLNADVAGQNRAKRLLNEAYRTICAGEAWPFLEATASGAAPLTVADLRFVRIVTDQTNGRPLEYVDGDDVRLHDPKLAATGNPVYWYRGSPTQIAVYPVSTPTIRVDYLKRPVSLSANGDVPLIPDEFHFLIVKGAALRANAYKGNADTEAAGMLRGDYERELQEMRESLLIGQRELQDIYVDTDFYG